MKNLPDPLLSVLCHLPLLSAGVVLVLCWLLGSEVPGSRQYPALTALFSMACLALYFSWSIADRAKAERFRRNSLLATGQYEGPARARD